jgi:CHAT domain-containing protein
MAFTQASFDRIVQEMWKVYSSRRFEETLPVLKALWERGEHEYVVPQDTMTYSFLNYGKTGYAQCLTLLGHYEEGLPMFEEALTEAEAFFGPILRLSHSYVGLGLAYSQYGDPYRALWAQNQASRIVELHVKPGDPNYGLVGNKYGNIGRVYRDLKQPDEAIKLFEEAEKAYRIAGDFWGVMMTYFERGKIAALNGNFELAQKYMEEARNYRKTYANNESSSVYINSVEAIIAQEKGNTDGAIANYEAAETAIANINQAEIFDLGAWVNGIVEIRQSFAHLLLETGRVSRAKQIIESGKALHMKATRDEKNMEGLKFRLMEAQLAATEGDWETTAERIESTIAILTGQGDVNWLSPEPDSAKMVPSPLLANAFRVSAEIQAAAGTYSIESILANCTAGKAVLSKIQQSYPADVPMDRLLRENQSLYDLSVEKSYLRATTSDTPESMEAYFRAIEEAHDQQLLGSLNAQQQAGYGLPENLLVAETDTRMRLRSYERLLHQERGKEKANPKLISEYTDHLRAARSRIDSLEKILQTSYPAYHDLKFRNTSIVLRDIIKTLGRDEAMVSYYVTPTKTYGILVTKREVVPFAADLGEGDIHDFNQSLQVPAGVPTPRWQQQSLSLYEQLLGPLRMRNVGELIIVPDKALHFLAWPALLTEIGPGNTDWRNLPYLIRSVNLRQESSATAFIQQKSKRYKELDYSYAGLAPEYDGDRYSMRSEEENDILFPGLSRLRPGKLTYNGDEVRFATTLFPDPITEIGMGATEEFFKDIAGNASVLHIASHGITNAYDPAASHLLFSSTDNKTKEDGHLYAWEIYGMKIPAELTVLSACQTGIGAIRKGIGVLSLARAFRYAGSKDVVMSLWAVNDRSTYQVMRKFFTGIKENQSKATALQQAMVHHLETEKDPELLHPYYWAGFSLIGPGEPIKPQNKLWWLILPLTILGIIGFRWKGRNKGASFNQ